MNAAPLLMPLALCWPFLSMAMLAACPRPSVRAASIGLAAAGLVLAVLAACLGGAWPATPFAVPSGLLRVLLPLPLLALVLVMLSPSPGAFMGVSPGTVTGASRGTMALMHGLAGGSAVATACADPLSGAVAVGGVAMLAALATATTRGAARLGWDAFRLNLSGILLAVPGAVLLVATPDAAGRLDGLGGVLLTVGLGTVAGLGPAAPVVMVAGDAPAAMALAPVMTAIPVLRHLVAGPDGTGTMLLGIVTLWLMVLPMRDASPARAARLALGGMIGLAAVAAGAGGRAGMAGMVALLASAALSAPLGERGAAWSLRPPFLPFGGLVLTLVAVCDAAPLLLVPLVAAVVAGRGSIRAAPPGEEPVAWLVTGLLLAGMAVLVGLVVR
ncbi:hypothetical protein [Gluconacetobacter diazotrophicus]|uniref:Uncharacterized protein n=2 Tax=Gluconacetobacter diazotrophicus TaxID=33996 RepID=A0A7W4FDC3_GLUDI|nr:hypothetical protein [Gluconacetobacter diazotrophicus]MBB2155474.1 hypothetical protein [Gluconacetobacter diazotrophicus]CAP57256.1 putative membrane protein [Gluconacetobacter diazotrophicus PA1 5]